VAKGYSLYLDVLLNNTVQNHLQEWFPMPFGSHFSSYPDLMSFSITLILTGMLSIGVKESTRFNSIFTCFNCIIVLFVIVVGAFKIDVANWNLPAKNVPENYGTGGFFPFGVAGMLSGAATCFYGFVGFDCIATSGEEVKNPARAIPIAIVGSLTIVFLAYFGVSTIETLIWPYYDTNSK
jgi:amino acid transporter